MVGYKEWLDLFFFFLFGVISDNVFDLLCEEDYKEYVVFGEIMFNFMENFKVIGGLRYFLNEMIVS